MERSIFDQVGNSKSTQGGNYIKDGKGRLIIDKLDLDKKTGGNFFVLEAVVESSQKIPVVSAVTGAKLDIEPNPPGSQASYVVPVDNPQIPSGPGNVKSCILALLGYTEADVDSKPGSFGEALAQLTDRDLAGARLLKPLCPGRGMVIDYETYRKAKKKKPTEELTLVRFFHVPPTGGNSAAEIKARREALEKRSSK